jgi:hypothetical protein
MTVNAVADVSMSDSIAQKNMLRDGAESTDRLDQSTEA